MIKRIPTIFLIFILSIALITGCDIINKNNEDNSQDITDNTTAENGDKNQKPSEPNDDYSGIDYDSSLTVTVTLEADNNSSVIGTKTQTVKIGGNVKFPVVFNTNYTFLNVEGNQNVVYSAGYVTVKNCKEDTVVKMSSALKTDLCSLRIQHTSPTFGIVELSVAPGNVLKNSIITATAKPSENQTFIGWSKNGSIVNGGTVVFGYCDLTGFRDALYPNDYYTQSVNAGTMSNSRAAVINNLHSQIQKSGIKYYFSCAPICYYNAKGTQSTDEQMTPYLNAAKSKLNCEVISNPLNYRYDNKTDYSNSAYHLCSTAAEKHTMKVIDDLKRVLN